MHDKFYEAGTAFFGAGAVIGLILVAIGLTTGLLTFMTVAAPGVVSRCSAAIRRHGFLCFLAGIGVFLVLALTGVVAHKLAPKAPVIAVLWVVLAAILAAVGLAAAGEDVGRRLFWISGREGTRVARLITGWVVSAAASFIPVLGWFVILPCLVLSGLGSGVVGIFVEGPAAPEKPCGAGLDLR